MLQREQLSIVWKVCAGAALLSLALLGCGGEQTTTSSDAAATGPTSSGGGPGGSGGPGPPPMMMTGTGMMGSGGSGGMFGGSASGFGQTPGGAAGGPQQAASAKPSSTAKPAARVDPFAPNWPPPPPPPALSLIAPVRVARYEAVPPPPEKTVEIQEVPNRRVAGILTGAGVYALVEGPDGQKVVKPGDPLDDYRVDSITSSAVVLKRTEGKRVYTQVVPLTDIGSSTAQVAAPRVGYPGMPGAPGMIGPPGGGFFPGRGRGGGGGALEGKE